MTAQQTTPLADYVRPIVARRAMISTITVVALGLGIVAALALPKRYTSTTSMLIAPISTDPSAALGSDEGNVHMATEIRIATSQAVASAVAAELASQSIDVDAEGLVDDVTAGTTEESRILDISFTASSPEVAQAGADAFATAYLAFRSELASGNKVAAETAINGRITILRERLAEVDSRVAATDEASSSRAVLTAERSSIERELTAQQTALADLSSLTIDTTKVLDRAVPPDSPNGLGLLQILVSAAIGGLALGIVTAYGRDAVANGSASASHHEPEIPLPRVPSAEIRSPELLSPEPPSSEVRSPDKPALEPSASEPPASQRPAPDRPASQPQASEPPPSTPPASEPQASQRPAPDRPASQPQASQPPSSEPPSSRPPSSRPPASQPPVSEPPSTPQGEPEAGDLADAAAPGAAPVPPALAGPPSGHGLDTDPETGAGTGSLITTTSMHGLLDELRQLGAVGPVVALSVGEENAGPALAIGFDLADKLQALGARVLMIDVVLDEPMLHALLGVDITPGLAEVLGGEVPLRNAVRPLPGLDGLHALTVGAATAMTAAALTGPPFERLLRDAKAEYHSILLVAGSVYDTRLVPAMANLVDGLIVGTGLPPGEPASPELAARLAALPAPTLELLSSMLTAEQPQGTASSTPGR